MKRILSILMIMAMLSALFAGCGKNERILYNEKLTKYVELGDYKGIKVDTKSDKFKEYYDGVISSDVESNGLYVKKTEGTVAKGDTANIDYVGKKDGVAFEGGTANGYDLEIGSGSFIDGFEDGLIDKKIGDTVDLNLTFPEGYQSEELAGKAVVFTVKINYVTTTEQRKPEEYYKELDFSTLEKYTEDVTERAVKGYLLNTVVEKTDIKNYPEKDIETLYTAYKNMLEANLQAQYGMNLESYLSQIGQTEEDLKKDLLENQIEPMMDEQMALYYILDNEKIKLTKEDTEKELNKLLDSYEGSNVTEEQIKEFYGEYYFEYSAVNELVVDFLYKNAEIK